MGGTSLVQADFRCPGCRTASRLSNVACMTLVLSVSCPAYSLHVSDRLVSKDGKPYDPLANKTVVFRATDGLLVFGYTGSAYIGSKPTDTWIAEMLARTDLGGDGTVRMGRFPVRDVGSSLSLLAQGLRADPNFPRLGGQVCAVGWQWSGKRECSLARNVLWQLHPGSGKLRWSQLVPRHIPERKRVFRMTVTGDWPLRQEDRQRLRDQVGAAGPDWKHVEGLLIDAVRRSSALKRGTIGSHCMSVLLRPSGFPNALVRFAPMTAHLARAFGQPVEVAYTPRMIAPDAIHAPAVMIGGWECAQGLLNYRFDAPPVPEEQQLKAALQTQQRPAA